MGRIAILHFSLLFLISCINPGGSSSSITDDHDPLNGEEEVAPVTVVDPDESDFEIYPYAIKSNGSSTARITITLRDTSRNPLSGKTVSLVSSRGAQDTITAIQSTSDTSGEVEFEVSSTTLGKPEFSATVLTDSVALLQTRIIRVLPESPYMYLWADNTFDREPGQNAPAASSIWQSIGDGTSLTASLLNFTFDSLSSASRWGGDGTAAITSANNGQHRIITDGTNDYLNVGASINTFSNLSFDAWIRPQNLDRGRVIFSNADLTTRGLTLRQSWDGQGYLSLHSGRSYAEVVLADNPVQYWRLGELSGSTFYGSTSTATPNAIEVAGVGNNGAGALGNDNNASATFTRPTTNNGALTVNDHPQLDNTTAFSLEAWVYMTGDCNTGICGIVSKRVGSASQEAYILYTDARNLIFRIIGNTGQQLTYGTSLSLNTWYHIVATFDGPAADTGVSPSVNHAVKIYINGTFLTSRTQTATSIPNTASSFAIGHLTGNNASGWSGRIDEVAYYNYALTASQVSAHYAARDRHAVHSDTKYNVNSWNHIGTSFDSTSGQLQLHLNGAAYSKTFASADIANSGENLLLGATDDDGTITSYWNGAMSELRIYDSALTAGEINSCFTSTSVDYP
jgi:hypothetical protein